VERINTKDIRETVSILDEIIDYYNKQSDPKKRDWRTYEQRFAERMKTVFKELKPLVHEAVEMVSFPKGETRGVKPVLSVEKRVIALLIKHLIGKSNRNMSAMFVIFSLLSDVDVSYKTVERFYSDYEVILVLHNLHILLLRKKGVKQADCSGDGTGLSLSVKVNYESKAQKLKDKAKKANTSKQYKKKIFVYSFKIMDIKTRMYIGFGTSFKSEQEAFLECLQLIEKNNTGLSSIRLDKYFSKQKYVNLLNQKFSGIKISIIPKKNSTIRGCFAWKKIMHDFVKDPVTYLEDYFQRNQSESSFAEDKRRTGWMVGQKRPDRVQTADLLTTVTHNLSWYR